MKTALALWVVTIFSVSAQTNFSVLSVAGQTFTNARITSVTASDAIVWHDGGGSKVALSNFPPNLQKQFGYDPEKAAKSISEIAKRKKNFQEQQAQAAVLANQMDEPENVQVAKILTAWGQCETSKGRIIINNIPPQTRDILTRIPALESQIANLSAKIESDDSEYRHTKATAPSYGTSDTDYVDAFYRRLDTFKENINDEEVRLGALQRQLKDCNSKVANLTMLLVAKTTKKYGVDDVYECFGLAPSKAYRK